MEYLRQEKFATITSQLRECFLRCIHKLGWRRAGCIHSPSQLVYKPCKYLIENDDGFTERTSPYEIGIASTIKAYVRSRVELGLCLQMGIIVAQGGETICNYSAQHHATDSIFDQDSILQMASLSKLVTATAVLCLVDDGLINVDNPISTYLPWDDSKVSVIVEKGTKKAARAITVVHLLTHTSGMAFLQGPRTLAELIECANTTPLLSQPGEAYSYNLDYDILGALVQIVCGKPFELFLKERIFSPLNMLETGFSLQSKRSTCYTTLSQGHATRQTSPLSWMVLFPSGAAGLLSSAADYIKFLYGLSSGKILSAPVLRMAMSNHLPTDVQSFKGPDNVEYAAHSLLCPLLEDGLVCWNGLYGTTAFAHPSSDTVGILYSNEATLFLENGRRSFFTAKFEVLHAMNLVASQHSCLAPANA